jgi:iron complex outermembrane recepter protein
MMRRHPAPAAIAFALVVLATSARTAHANELPPPPSSSLTGTVLDAETREPIGWATVAVVELKRAERTHRDGTFHLIGIPSGRYTLRVTYLGYETVNIPVSLPLDDSVDVVVELRSTALASQTVVVTAERERTAEPYRPDEVISGAVLQQRLGRTLAETIGGEAGISQRTMGPAAARPVVRGLGGDRLQLLEDGVATGDLSSTSSDHAVAIDPLNAERIEIVQGPQSLLYTSNALGGVVNVVRNRIAGTQPDRVHGIVSLQGESVNTGYTGGLSAAMPLGPIALQLDGSGRRAADITTPAGALGNTDYSSYNGSVGLSHIGTWGVAGAAVGVLHTEYGIPGGFAGAHAEGVRIEMERQFAEGSFEVLPQGSDIRRVEVRGSASRYRHQELEMTGDVGTEYGLLSGEVTALAHHDTLGPFARGSIGAHFDARNLVANGVNIPPSDERTIAVVAYEEAPLDRWTFRGAARVDHRTVTPDRERTSTIGVISERAFTGVSGSLGVLYNTSPSMQLGITAIRSFRTPTIDELFSEGPHLASYSYEVGNPALDAETGLGLEASARYADDRGHLAVALFRNDIDGYIYPRNTGDTSFRLRLPIYQQTGAHVVMMGVDASAEWELLDRLVLSGSIGYVLGDLVDEDRPLPMIPPLAGRLGLRYAWKALTVGASVRGASAQERIGDFEEPTAGYVVADLSAQFQYVWGSFLHTFALSIDNIADTEYRSHLSRTKSIMPEPGRNARLLYRVFF